MHFPEDFFRWLVIFFVRAQQHKKPLFVGTLFDREKIGKALTRIALAVALSTMPVSLSFAQQPREQSFNIPQQSVQTALTSLANQANVYLLFPYDQVIAVNANAVQGTYSVQQALNILLHNTGLSGDLTEGGVLAISRAGAHASATENHGKGKSMNTTNSSKRKTVLAGLVGLFAATGGVGSALAQGGEAATGQSAIDEIIVTANKRGEVSSLDIPMSIVALSGESIDRAGLQSISDLSYIVPNLSVSERGPGLQTITIRGIGNQNGIASLVGIYLDEVPMALVQNGQPNLQAIDLQRVEVLRGPQGTLYGQGSVGGTVRFVTNKPTFDGLEGNVQFSAYDTRDGDWTEDFTGVLNLPVIDDVLGFRIAASYRNKGGWIDQPAASRKNVNDSELSHIRIKSLWKPTDPLAINLMAIRHRNSAGHDNLVNEGTAKEHSYISAVDPAIDNDVRDDYDLTNLTITYDLSFGVLTSASSYFDIAQSREELSSFLPIPSLPAPLERTIRGSTMDIEIFSQELRLASNDNGSRFGWTAGVFYSDSDIVQEFGSLDFTFGSFPLASTPRHSESIAYFADISYQINDQLMVGVGTRYFEDDKDFQEGSITLSETFDKVSSKLYLSYSVDDDINLFMTVSEGFRSGGFNRSTAPEPSYGPETLLSYDAGIKALLLDKSLLMEFALYYSEYTDFQTIFTDPLTAQSFTSNPGKAEIRGVELNFKWAVTNDLSLSISGNLTDAELVEINTTSPTLDVGDPLDFVPENSYSISADYEFMWSDRVDGFASFSYNRQGKNHFTLRNSGIFPETFVAESIGLLNASIGAVFKDFDIQFFGRNLLDEYQITTATPAGVAQQERPRTIGLKLQYSF